MLEYILGLITARGGSKGIPGKNIKPLGGKPLIQWSIDAALTSSSLSRVLVSTDDPIIAASAREGGAEVPFLRPKELSGDASPHIDVVLHALDWLLENERMVPDYVMLLQPTSPFRTSFDIDAAVHLAREGQAEAVVGVCEAVNSPFHCKQLLNDGRMRDLCAATSEYVRRQDLPPAYVVNGALYLNTVSSLRRGRTFFPQSALAYVMPRERSVDIDTPWDFHLAELLASHPFMS